MTGPKQDPAKIARIAVDGIEDGPLRDRRRQRRPPGAGRAGRRRLSALPAAALRISRPAIRTASCAARCTPVLTSGECRGHRRNFAGDHGEHCGANPGHHHMTPARIGLGPCRLRSLVVEQDRRSLPGRDLEADQRGEHGDGDQDPGDERHAEQWPETTAASSPAAEPASTTVTSPAIAATVRNFCRARPRSPACAAAPSAGR